MDINDIDAVLNVSGTLEQHGYDDAAHTPGLIADLFRWADSRANQLAAGHTDIAYPDKGTDAAKPKRGSSKAKPVGVPEDSFEASPDPSADEPDF